MCVRGVAVTAISAALPPGSKWGRVAEVGQADAIATAVDPAGSPKARTLEPDGHGVVGRGMVVAMSSTAGTAPTPMHTSTPWMSGRTAFMWPRRDDLP